MPDRLGPAGPIFYAAAIPDFVSDVWIGPLARYDVRPKSIDVARRPRLLHRRCNRVNWRRAFAHRRFWRLAQRGHPEFLTGHDEPAASKVPAQSRLRRVT